MQTQKLIHGMIKRIRDKLGREASYFKKALVEKGLARGTREYKQFIIVSDIRSGSTMLGSYLSSHPEAVCFFELFHNFKQSIPFGQRGYERRGNQASVVSMRNDDPKRFLQQYVFNRHCPEIKAVGFKLLYTQGHCEKQWWHSPQYKHWWMGGKPPDLLPREKSCLWDYLVGTKDIVVIHLIRRNLLARLVSFHKALRSGKWGEGATGGYAEDFDLRIDINPTNLRKDLEAAERFEGEVDAKFAGHKVLKITYEELVSSPDTVIGTVTEQLGLSKRGLVTRTRKQNRQPISHSIRNFDELRCSFVGTKWEYLFREATV